jgi:sigma-B regulation protein RsbU (phosphoserine phosphatase)
MDPIYSTHHTPVSVPIIHKDGRLFGTLCAIDPRPARLQNPETIGMFKLFAELIASHLDNADGLRASQVDLRASQASLTASEASLTASQANLKASRAALLEEQGFSELREQFIAVLGHDLRNPVASIFSAARRLTRDPPPDRQKMLLAGIQAAVVRMSVLIDNVMDFARGRLGAGIPLEERPDVMLAPVIEQVVDELRLGAPDRIIETDFDLPNHVKCDQSRIAQLVSNLLGNALTHGSPEKPVRIHADSKDATLTIWVANSGDPISPAARERLFQPFFRGEVRASQQGLGLGLHIASEIAKAHGGTLTVSSTPEETRFTFQACGLAA